MRSADGHRLNAHLCERRVVICLGAGGVGKTTTSAALALGLAIDGRRVAVVTIDPAKRLAAALGLTELSGNPRQIDLAALEDAGIEVHGELWAMMLDAKQTFDEVIADLAPDERAREEILANPVYRELSTAVAGSQELSAVSKLYELHEGGEFDVIVLDTPPSRNALDFLEAPGRLLGFLDGRALQVFLAPGGLTARLFGRGTAIVFAIFARVTGVDMLGELSRFFRSLSGVIEGFALRTRSVAALMRSEESAFVIVTSPQAEAAGEAVFLAERLAAAGLQQAQLVVNRVHTDRLEGSSEEQLAAQLQRKVPAALARRLAGNLADFDLLARRDADTIATLSRRLGGAQAVVVGQLDEEIQDLFGLVRVAERLLD